MNDEKEWGMAEKKSVSIGGKNYRRGKKMVKGRGWRLLRSKRVAFKGTLLDVYNIGSKRLALFSVPKNVA
jgi:hypothetical protein